MSQCEGITKSGNRCRNRTLHGRPWCFTHDPAIEEERQEWRRQGGFNSGISRRYDREMKKRMPDFKERIQKLEIFMAGKGYRP